MVSRILIKVIICTLIPTTLLASSYKCELSQIESLVVKNISETRETCFHLKDDSYFISKNCLTLECSSLNKIKTTRLKYSESMRPGQSWCQSLGGVVEIIKISTHGENLRCIFIEDSSYISLNLLESWNGSNFAGPKLESE